VWDWALGKFLVFYDSGHRSNVFQVSLWHTLFVLLVELLREFSLCVSEWVRRWGEEGRIIL
jgi:hypothetical protein